MKYKELAKKTFLKASKEVFKPKTTNIRRAITVVFYGVKEIFMWILQYLFGVVYLITFPISSIIVYLLYKRLNNIKETKQDKINKKFNNIHNI